MKGDKELQAEIFNSFVKAHPELQFNTNNQIQQMSTADKGAYASIAIEYTIKWLKDEEALKHGLILPKYLKFEQKDGKYEQVDEDDEKLPSTSGKVKEG